MRTGNNYSGARWGFSGRRPSLFRRCVRCGNTRHRDKFVAPRGRICEPCRSGDKAAT